MGHDDYYNAHVPGCFDLADSPYLTQGRIVTVTVKGSGRVTSAPTGIDCPSACAAGFEPGTKLTLTATPDAGHAFHGWSGACSDTAACMLTVDGVKAVQATFTGRYRLTVRTGRGGRVLSTERAIACPKACTAVFREGKTVRLVAKPSRGYRFLRWTGACAGTHSCTVTMHSDQAVVARFAKRAKR